MIAHDAQTTNRMTEVPPPRETRARRLAGLLLITFGLVCAIAFTWAAADRWDLASRPPLAALLRLGALLGLGALALLKPRWGACLIFFAIPFFGNRPGGRFMEVLNILVAANLAGLAVRAVRRRHPLPDSALWWAGWACVGSAAVALVPALPGIMGRWVQVNDLPLATIQALTSRESDPLYSINSLLQMTLAVAWATILTATGDRFHLALARAATAAFLLVMLLGALDFHRLIDLDAGYLRLIDDRSDDRSSFQSIFWNPGWFAWYFAMAFGLALGLSFVERHLIRWPLLASLAIAYTYFLTNPQRGGFIAVHAMLLLAGAIFSVGHIRRRPRFVALTLATLLLLPAGVWIARRSPDGSARLPSVQRLAAGVTDTVRGNLAATALAMWRSAPLFGIGEAAFAWRYREYVPPGSPLEVPTYGDAHSTWLQILATRGLVGFAAYLTLWGVIVALAFRALRGPDRAPTDLAAILALGSFLVYSFVQNMFYLQSTQVHFWGLLAFLGRRAPWRPPRKATLLTSGFLILLLAGAVSTHLGPLREARTRLSGHPRGFYDLEHWGGPTGRLMRWSARTGTLCLYPEAGVVTLDMLVTHPDVATHPVTVTLYQGERRLEVLQFTTNGLTTRVLHLDRATDARGIGRYRPFGECDPDAGQVTLTVRVSRTWSPASRRVADDPRHLGVAVFAPR